MRLLHRAAASAAQAREPSPGMPSRAPAGVAVGRRPSSARLVAVRAALGARVAVPGHRPGV